jgi:hypothetical protein
MNPKLTELTPAHLQSWPVGCPAIFVTDDGRYYIIGKRVDAKQVGLEKRVMDGEELIEVTCQLIDEAVQSRANTH